MSSTDIASTVGTWVAVFLALFALLGVLGPILVWRASRTLRNQALARLDAGLAENGGFVSKGLYFTKDIRLFRRVKAPILRKEPQVQGHILTWNTNAKLPWQESASWVQLGAALRAYGLAYPLGDDLMYTEDGRTQLPIKPVWLLVLGLQGRFGIRKDSGKWPRKTPKGLPSKQPRPGLNIHRDTTAHQHRHLIQDLLNRPDHWAEDFSYYGGHNDAARGLTRLAGVVGSLTLYRTPGANSVTTFATHEAEEIGPLPVETLSIASLFWLSVGCLPIGDRKFLSLEDVQSIAVGPADDMDETTNARRRNRSSIMDRRPGVHFAEADAYDDASIHSDDDRYGYSRPRRASLYVDVPKRQRSKAQRDPEVPRRFCFADTEDRVDALVDFAVALGAETENTETLTLQEIIVSSDDLPLLQEDAGRTYVPSDRDWVRMGMPRQNERSPLPWFLDRPDAQMLARALVQLPICPQGFLIYNPPKSACREFLAEASSLLPRILNYLLFDLELFGLEDSVQTALMERISRLYKAVGKYSYTRNYASTVYELDKALQENIKCLDWESLFVQVVALTSSEFRDLINQSLRNIKDCVKSQITIDVSDVTASVNVPAAFGMIQRFPIDTDVLMERADIPSIVGQHVLSYPTVLLLFLKAVVRSTFLRTSLDSMPLWDVVLSAEEVVVDGNPPSAYSQAT
jgi:hypothetical protein